jgi:predicted dehydrogenase
LRIGVVGNGWGRVYCKALERQGIEFWRAGRNWQPACDALIVASSNESHFEVAHRALSLGIPVLVEKPVCLKSSDVQTLIDLGGIALAGHTRLYDPAWAEFKRGLSGSHVRAFAGGVTESNPDPEWNWLPHIAAMCLDIGVDPMRAFVRVTEERQPLRFQCGGREFRDTNGAIDCLVREFVKAVECGEPDNEGLKLGLKVVQYVEGIKSAKVARPRGS